MKQKDNKKKEKILLNQGLTLLEVIIAIFLITVGTLGALALITRTISVTGISSQKAIAAYLAQEGIEIVRNIRDGNWLEQRTNPAFAWDDGLGVGDWEGDYNDQILTQCSPIPFNCPSRGFPLHPLRINGGFYNHTFGISTLFFRRITIFDKTADMFKVSVLVSWQEKGKTYQLQAQENLYNWR